MDKTMSKDLIGMAVAYVAALVAPHLSAWGLPDYVSQEWVAVVATVLFASSATVKYLISKAPKVYGMANIAVSLVEESIADAPNDIKKSEAFKRLCEMIDATDMGLVQKKLLKWVAPTAIEAVVKQAKVLIYKVPPIAAALSAPEEPPKAIPAT